MSTKSLNNDTPFSGKKTSIHMTQQMVDDINTIRNAQAVPVSDAQVIAAALRRMAEAVAGGAKK